MRSLRPPRTTRATVNAEYGETFIHSGWAAFLPWAWPWLATPALLALAGLLYGLWGRQSISAGFSAVGLTLAVLGLASLAWRAGRARGPVVRAGAAAAVLAAGMWLIGAIIAGPLTRPVIDVWVLGALVGPLSANIVRALRGDGHDGNGGWATLGERVRLPGSRVLSASGDERRVRAVVEVAPGEQTQDDVAANSVRIASALGVPAGGVRVTPDPDNARRANVTVVRRDLLREPIVWPGPSAAGRSIADPLVLGVRESGEPLQLWLPGDERTGRSATHVLITGMTGAGKSVAGRLILAEALTRDDVAVWVIDVIKGQQFVGPFRSHVERLATTADESATLVASLPDLIAGRADELGRRGHDQWAPGCGLPYLLVHVEEASSAVAKSRPFVRAAQTARSAGVSLVVSLQRATHENLPTDLRSQLGAVLAFGCRPGDERFGLTAETVEAGAAPQRWGNTRPGYVYAEVPGVDPDEWSSPARTYIASAPAVRAALGEGVSRTETPGEARAIDPRTLLRARVEAIRESGAAELRPADLSEVLTAGSRSKAWLSGELRALVVAGILIERGRGLYGFGSH